MEMVKLFRGTETQIAAEMAAFYNRQGAIGNRVANAKLLTYEDGSIGMSVKYTGKVDDGRQIDGILDKKSFLIYRTSGTDTSPVDEFLRVHGEAGDDMSVPFVTTVGNDTIYFVAANKMIPHNDAWNNDSDDDEDDWTPAGTPTVAPTVAPTASVDDVFGDSPFN